MTSALSDGPGALPAQPRRALLLCAWVLLGLTVAKTLGGIAYLGPALLSLAAFAQLYLPMRECERLGAPYSAVGLSWRAWPRDVQGVLLLALTVLPLYGLGVHLLLTQARPWAQGLQLSWAAVLPQARWAPPWPQGVAEWGVALGGSIKLAAVHVLGVALPEETFYRGYLQAQLQAPWPPQRRWLGVPVGRAALLSALLFAVGHVLGEWNPARMAPFLPALLFAWLRNRSQTVVGAVLFHGLCNVFSELWFACYR